MLAHSTTIRAVAQPLAADLAAELATGTTANRWKQELSEAIRDPAELLQLLHLPNDLLAAARSAAKLFPLRVPLSYLARIEAGKPDDPLLRQVLPIDAELETSPGYSADPVGDAASMASQGLLHKYQGRALLITTGACAVHCRYCFRRHYPYSEASAKPSALDEALDYIAADNSLKEIILSGGDPLSLSDARLQDLVQALEAIPHLQRLRIHTRQPVVIPSRITEALLNTLQASRLRVVVVLHINHANEINHELGAAIDKLNQIDALLLNQAVLLKGVNDSAEAIINLSEALDEVRVQPYYLHTLDKVQGAAHFAVSDDAAKTLIKQAAATLPGYLTPKLVRETAGKDYKSLLL